MSTERPETSAPFVVRRWVEVAGESSRKVALWTKAVDVVERGPPRDASGRHGTVDGAWIEPATSGL